MILLLRSGEKEAGEKHLNGDYRSRNADGQRRVACQNRDHVTERESTVGN